MRCCPLPPLRQTIMAQPQPFFDASTKGDLVSRLTVDVTVLQTTLAGAAGTPGLLWHRACSSGWHEWVPLGAAQPPPPARRPPSGGTMLPAPACML